MRTLLGLALAFTVQAYACPDLTGSYTCTYSDGTSEVATITQSVVNGVTVYNYNGNEVRADNVAYPMPEDQTLKEGTFRSWCSDAATLNAEILGKYYNNGAYYGDLAMNMTFVKEGANLKQSTTGNLKSSRGDNPFSDSITCVGK